MPRVELNSDNFFLCTLLVIIIIGDGFLRSEEHFKPETNNVNCAQYTFSL